MAYTHGFNFTAIGLFLELLHQKGQKNLKAIKDADRPEHCHTLQEVPLARPIIETGFLFSLLDSSGFPLPLSPLEVQCEFSVSLDIHAAP